VLLRHETQTGEGTSVVFYSLYMHLANQADLAADRLVQLPTWLRQSPGTSVRRPANQRVWRKDVLGFAGQLYNREALHFEVFMLNADCNNVWRDSSATTEGNGSDDWFGDAHFVIPAKSDFAERHPRAPATGAHRIDFPGNADFPLPQGQAGQNESQLCVSVSLRQGNRVATTYRAKDDGTYEQLGRPVVQEGYEYELFRLATALYPDCPSAGLEWLRFGRVLGTDTTNRTENWQLVRYSAEAIGYIDLAPRAIAKLSDADFPHWHGWERRDEGSTTQATDGICDDKRTIALSQARDQPSLRKLRHLVCKAPTEWDNADLATRYARLREPGQPLQDDANWKLFEQHVGKLAFWGDSGLTGRSVWHFHPLQFIRHFRRCAWLSQNEFRQLQPSHAVRTGISKGKPAVFWERVNEMSLSEKDVPVRYRVPLNKMMRKYGIDSGKRQAAFFGNSIQETQWLTQLQESSGDKLWYAPWYGRGFLQLTNPGNYCAYWAWRGRAVPAALRKALVAAYDDIYSQDAAKRSNAMLQDSKFPALTQQMIEWRDNVRGDPKSSPTTDAEIAPADSAGFYWVKLQMGKYADEPHRLERQTLPTGTGEKVYYRSEAFWRASAAVNLPSALRRTYSPALNGFDSRCSAYGVALAVLTETRFPNAQGTPLLGYPEGYSERRP
jgi:hypothetical protein